MSLTKVERQALKIFAKTCKPKDSCGTALRGCVPECEFDMCCLKCFLRGEIHRLEEYDDIMPCGEELHNYFDDNTILSEEYPLAGLEEEDVRKAISMLQAIRRGKKPDYIMRHFFGITEEHAENAAKLSKLIKKEPELIEE